MRRQTTKTNIRKKNVSKQNSIQFSVKIKSNQQTNYVCIHKKTINMTNKKKGPGPPDDDSPMEPQPPDLGTSFNQHNHSLNNNNSSANLNNNNHIHHTHVSDSKEQYGSRQGSLTNSTR